MNIVSPRDSLVKFEAAAHSYTVRGEGLRSVSSIVAACFPPFDYDKVASFMAKHRPGMSHAEILEELRAKGDASCDLGHRFHALIDTIARRTGTEETVVADDVRTLHEQWHRWMTGADSPEAREKELMRTEWVIFSEKWKVAGTIDAIVRVGCQLWLVDWKTVKSLDAEKVARYNLQLQLYDYILRKEYGIKCDRLLLVQVHATRKKAREVEVPRSSTNVYLESVLRGEYVRQTEEERLMDLYDT